MVRWDISLALNMTYFYPLSALRATSPEGGSKGCFEINEETALCGEKYEGNKKIMCNCYALRTQYFAGNGEINGRIGQIGEVENVNAYPDREPLCTPENGNLYFPYCEAADFPQISGLYRCNGLPMGCGRPERPRPPRPCGRGNNCCCMPDKDNTNRGLTLCFWLILCCARVLYV